MRFRAPTPLLSRPVRVCAVQYALRPVASPEEFARRVEAFVDVGDDYDADLIVFPELLTAQLIGCLPAGLKPAEAMREIADSHTALYDGLFTRLADQYQRIIVAGTHPRRSKGRICNTASVFFPGQPPVHQPKLHLTPSEQKVWNFTPGHDLHVIATEFGRFAVAICYDVQFPEAGRVLCEAGTELLIVPYLTDDRRGWSRVTLCARARAVENQIYVVTAGMVGSLPLVTDLTSQYAQSGIYTPSDYAFPPDGIATEATANTEMVIVNDLDFAVLDRVRAWGSVTNHADASRDGLSVKFEGRVQVHRRPFEKRPPAGQAASAKVVKNSPVRAGKNGVEFVRQRWRRG